MILLTTDLLDDLGLGAAVLGTGGGGDPYIGKLLARAAIETYGPVELIALEETPDDARVAACGGMGAPTIVIEKIPSGEELHAAFDAYEAAMGAKVDAIIPFEAGGLNSMAPLFAAAKRRTPVIDADGMGRAFPQLEMETFNVYGVDASPVAIGDEGGDTVIVQARNASQAEWLARGVTIRMGGQSWVVNYGMSGATAKKVSVPGTLSLALGIGKSLREARVHHQDPIASLIAFLSGTHYETAKLVATGKITDVERTTRNGWSVGVATIAPFDPARGLVRITIQNEYLLAMEGDRVLAIVPDLVCLLDVDTAEPITTERLRYGQRVNVLAIQTPPIMRTPEALKVFGPRCFGLDYDYTPIAE
jgi:uncharacterized protein